MSLPSHWVDGHPLDTDRWWVSDDSGMPSYGGAAAGGVQTPGHHGMIPTRGSILPATYRLNMVFEADSYGELIRDVSTVKSWMIPSGKPTVELVHHPEGVPSAYSQMTWARLVASVEPERTTLIGGLWADAEFKLDIPSGRWYDLTEITTKAAKGASTLLQFEGGGAPTDQVTVSFSAIGSTTDVKITDVASGAWMRVAGNITAGAVVTVNPREYTATLHSGADISGLLDFGPIPFSLSPQAQINIAQNGTNQVTFKGRRAYV